MEPIFAACENAVFYLVSGEKEKALQCAKDAFTLLDSSQAEGAGEKHLPEVKKDGNRIQVRVGSVLHPMSAEHSIEWIFLETKKGGQFRRFTPDNEPTAEFAVAPDDEAVAVYAYCNLHGFWKTSI
ncbi:MAG: desulfoferrodoxin [Lachnospiraceae bacterium]|nr:desulfoferrodoxin [Lachnospiraceae bacterium]MDE7240171.1 desulfoferrodoxin [Lachnospiraceae bacterium]